MARALRAMVALALGGCWTPHLAAAPLVPGPDDAGHDASLASKAGAFDRQLHALSSLPVGFGLEAFVDVPANRALVDQFIASGQWDFEAATGAHPYSVVTSFGEQGDLGMFGGVQAAGDAFHYAVLRDTGAPAADVARARDQLMRAMQGLHWYHQVTGVPGVIARGILRITPEAGDPALPGTPPATLPLLDANGDPQPADKEPTWRADGSGRLPFLIWFDDTSKDQFDGWVMGVGAAWEVAHGDPAIPSQLADDLAADALAVGRKLRARVSVGAKQADLVLVDADGRPTSFHDVSAEEVAPGLVLDNAANGFNAWMALGAIRTFHAMTGDAGLGDFYRELVARGYLDAAEATLKIIYSGDSTNFSNVNMAVVSAYNLLRFENDAALRAQAARILEQQLYAPGKAREPRGEGQSFFDFVYAAFRSGGASGAGATAVAEGTATLAAFHAAPYWDTAVENCDAGELAAGTCLAIDGSTTLTLNPGTGHNGQRVAASPLPIAIRPPSNFEWRSDPHSVNGGGSTRLNPGGDFHAAYWLGRFLQTSGDNLSPRARDLPPAGGTPDGAAGAGGTPDGAAGAGGTPDGAAGAGGSSAGVASYGDDGRSGEGDEGCGCSLPGRDPRGLPALALAALLGAAARRRSRVRRRA